MRQFRVSVLLLTYNRPDEIKRNLRELTNNLSSDIEIVVVDNFSNYKISEVIEEYLERINLIIMDENFGVAARNIGMSNCSSDIVITLDDDVFGLTQSSIELVAEKFYKNSDISAINFKVVDDLTENQINWIHHRKLENWGNCEFETYEISEGAVAFRRSLFLDSGGYPEHFFISHEGPYLALELLNRGFEIIYFPDVIVRHAHAEGGRESWRRYYYDTRNLIWLSFHYLPISLLIKKVLVELGALFIYSLRDGYFKIWLEGIKDGILGVKIHNISRSPIGDRALRKYQAIKSKNPSLLYMIKIRIFSGQKKVKI
jgi:GT2 family glycosyltransferase